MEATMTQQSERKLTRARPWPVDRRGFLSMTVASGAAMATLLAAGDPAKAKEGGEWDKVFPKSDDVTHQKVTFPNRFGIML
jgi:hypothetical protein